MGYSEANISYAVRILAQKGCIELDGDHIELTEEGKKLSEDMLEKNQFFTNMLIRCGIAREGSQPAEGLPGQPLFCREMFTWK